MDVATICMNCINQVTSASFPPPPPPPRSISFSHSPFAHYCRQLDVNRHRSITIECVCSAAYVLPIRKLS